jgi:hypothetical protein
MKASALRVMRIWRQRLPLGPPTPREIGRNAAVHCRPCSGWMDQPGKEVPSPRERSFDYVE